MNRFGLVVLLALVVTLLVSGVALAATPQEIYDDFEADGRLDGSYSEAELQAYLDDTAIHQYGTPSVVSDLDALVEDLLAEEEQDGFPFTGFELAIALFGGVALLGSGVLIRKWAQ